MKKLLSKKKIFKTNLIFIFIFLNIWEFILSRELFNGMIFGLLMFGPVAFLWFMKTLRASMLATFVSIFEVTVLAVFVIEGFEFGGVLAAVKSIYWVPYLAMAIINMIVGLKIYADFKGRKAKKVKT
ncbi:MAG: hypothetical protein Q7S45_00480 [Candidatus Curtissbacteria bacterium]|nr:hypothetical protein [Candidatus Curtissbacteria bacterium]